MILNLLDMVRHIAIADVAARRSAVIEQLAVAGLPFERKVERFDYRPENIIVHPLSPDTPRYVIGAHYDAVPGSTGANDNATGVAIALRLLSELQTTSSNFPYEGVLFDEEETGMHGALGYIQRVTPSKILGMINLDICGVGDTVLISYPRHHGNNALLQAVKTSLQSGQHPVQSIDRLPGSDDRAFEHYGIPAISICTLESADIDLMLQSVNRASNHAPPAIIETMHNGVRDTIDVVNETAMQSVLAYVRDVWQLIEQFHHNIA